MALILHIDTATDYGAVGLSFDSLLVTSKESGSQKEHASFLQPAIAQIMKEADKSLCAIDALAVSIGPGSYTGLRVGLASAKGLCYALDKPLITVNTLQAMAVAAIEKYKSENQILSNNILFCPMIDARRMEVYTALYNAEGLEIAAPAALIIEENMYAELLMNHQIIFSGNGSLKLKNVCNHPNISVIICSHSIKHISILAIEKFKLQQFTEIAYCEPLYLKPFYMQQKK